MEKHMEQFRKRPAQEAEDQLTPDELADLARDELMEKNEQEGDPTQFTESESGRQLSDEELKHFDEIDEQEKAAGTRWSFRRPLEDLAKKFEGMPHEQAIFNATNVFTKLWRDILDTAKRGEEPDFSEFRLHGGTDESIEVLKTIAKDLSSDGPGLSAAA